MISPQLKAVILEALGLDDYPLTAATIAPDVPGWDSLRHLEIIGEVENAFGVRFRAHEVVALPDVGSLQQLVDRKLAEKAAKKAG
jgi:acyl carrier protein